MSEVDSDLVRSAGLELAAQQAGERPLRPLRVALQDLVMGDRLASMSVVNDRHLFPVPGAAIDVGRDRAAAPARRAQASAR